MKVIESGGSAMNTALPHVSKIFFTVLHWIGKQIVDDVPPEIALCEFDCDKTQCTLKEWESCPRRLSKPAGELMPLRRAS